MPSYDVTVIHYHTVNIEASDEDEAADLAIEMESHGQCWEMEVDDIILIEDSDPEDCYSPYCYNSYCVRSPVDSGYVAYSEFSQPATLLQGTTLSNGYTTYC